MEDETLEAKCKNAIFKIADDVRDINQKLSHFLESYRDDYNSLMNRKYYASY